MNKKYAFDIIAGNQLRTYHFYVENERPIKIGDGTFGAVFLVEHADGGEYVVKLLYNIQITSSFGPPQLTKEVITAFQAKFQISEEAPVLEELQRLLNKPLDDLCQFTLNLQSLKLPNEQYCFLLNLTQQSQSIVLKRFNHEIESAIKIRERFRQKKGSLDNLRGVVEVIGGTTQFRSSPAYETLKDIFNAMQIEVSNYALVMPYYKWTLKDLLERDISKFRIKVNALASNNIPAQLLRKLTNLEFEDENELRKYIDDLNIENEVKIGLKQDIYKPVGYDILKSMGFEERIKTIVPYLLDIAQGIRSLHWAEFYHHDLKPANIFVKGGDTVEVVVGDLGFIRPREELTHTRLMLPQLRDALPLGTRHYRSPEQKDYFDICNVSVTHRDITNTGNREVVLIVSDPKFQDSIIEEGDTLIFSKDKDQNEYPIARIEKKPNETCITLRGRQEELLIQIKEDDLTQIILYKRHQVRTDLFGLGAIAFDLLTCGRSPERFYDNIRSYDREPNSDDPGKGNIEVILEDYEQVSTFQSAKPTAVPVFAPFRHEQRLSQYAPKEFVEVILKCMLYKAKGTYFSKIIPSENDHNYYQAVETVLQDLVKLNAKFRGDKFHNKLLYRTFEEDDKDDKERKANFSETLDKLQNLSSPNNIPQRLGDGIFYFKKLVELVRKTVDRNKGFGSFAEMLPRNIVQIELENTLGFSYFTYAPEGNYAPEGDYKDDLRNDSISVRITRNPQDPYVPDELIAMRRPIELEYIRSYTFQYRFLDSSPQGNQIEPGDWIIVKEKLWQVESILDHKEITLKDGEISSMDSLEPKEEQERLEGIYYKKLEPCKYYLSMLGIYLHQIFFAYIGKTTRDKPLAVDIARKAIFLYSNSAVKIKPQKYRNLTSLDVIFRLITCMYLQLIFHEDKYSFYRQGAEDFNRLGRVLTETEILQAKIEKFLGIEERGLDVPRPELYNKDDKWVDRNISQTFLDELDFNKYILKFMEVSTKSSWLSKIFS